MVDRVTIPQGTAARLSRPDIARFVGPAPSRVKIQRAAGHTEDVAAAGAELRPGDMLGATVAGRAVARRQVLGQPALALPYRFVALTAADTQVLVVLTMPTTLSYSAQAKAFRGTVNFVLYDSLNPARTGSPPSPINLFTSVPNGRASPDNFPLVRINLPPTAVRVTGRTAADSLLIRVSTTLDPKGVDVWLPVDQPFIKVEPVHRSIWGYGLQTSAVHVTTPLEAGSTAQTVRLRASAGEPEPSSLTLAGGATGEVTIRSSGVGTDTLWADITGFHSRPATIVYKSPILFFVAATLGALVGAFFARTRSTRAFLRNVLVGIFMAVAFAIGLNLTGFDIPTHVGEAVVFVVAVLGAWQGVAALKAARSKKSA